jgi:hypothetical protein
MPQRPLAKKARQTHNISELRSQQRDSSVASGSSGHPTPARSLAPSPEGDESDLEEDDDDLDLLIHFDSLKTNLAYEEEHPDDMELDENEELVEWEGFGREDLAEVMVDMFDDDDPGDLDWLPTNLRAMRDKKRRKKQTQGKPKGRYPLIFMTLNH